MLLNDAGQILARYLPMANIQLFNGRREGECWRGARCCSQGQRG